MKEKKEIPMALKMTLAVIFLIAATIYAGFQ